MLTAETSLLKSIRPAKRKAMACDDLLVRVDLALDKVYPRNTDNHPEYWRTPNEIADDADKRKDIERFVRLYRLRRLHLEWILRELELEMKNRRIQNESY